MSRTAKLLEQKRESTKQPQVKQTPHVEQAPARPTPSPVATPPAPTPTTQKNAPVAAPVGAGAATGRTLEELLTQRTHVQNEKEALRNKANWLVSGGPAKEGITFIPQKAVDDVWARYDMYDEWEKELDVQIAQARNTPEERAQTMAQAKGNLDATTREQRKADILSEAQNDADTLLGYTSPVPGSDLQNMVLQLTAETIQQGAERRVEQLDYAGKRLEDTYEVGGGGQFEANMDLGAINQKANAAWNAYYIDPTSENREIAYTYAALLEQVQENAAGALSHDGNAKWLTQSVAGYLPQFWDQLKAQAGGALVGGVAVGLLTGGTGAGAGARFGSAVASARESYDNVRGQVFRDLVMLGVDEVTAREAAADEAFVSAIIEGAETFITWGSVGFDDIIGMFTGAAGKASTKGLATKLLSKLPTKAQPAARVGLGVVQEMGAEYLEEAAQEGVSIANERRLLNGGETGKADLVGEAAGVIGGAVTGQDPEALRQMHESGTQGALLGGLSAGTLQTVSQIATARTPKTQSAPDPLAQAIFGADRAGAEMRVAEDVGPNGANSAENPAVLPQDGAGARMDGKVGVGIAAEQSPAQAAQEQDGLMRAMFGENVPPTEADVTQPAAVATMPDTRSFDEIVDGYSALTEREREVLSGAALWQDSDTFAEEIRKALSVERPRDRTTRTIRSAMQKLGGDMANLNDLYIIAGDDFSAVTIERVVADRVAAAELRAERPVARGVQSTRDLAQQLFGEETKNAAPEVGTAVNDDPADHTPREQAVIEAYKQSADDALKAFITRVRSLTNSDYRNKIRTTIATKTRRAAEAAQRLTGVDTSESSTIMKGNAVGHVDKRHGANGKADHSMANLDDFSRIGFVLDNFTHAEVLTLDNVDEETAKLSREWMNSDNTPAVLVRYSMPVNGIYYVVEAVPDSNARVMAVVSAYMTKGAKKENSPQSSAEHDPGTNGQLPQRTPEAPHEMLENSNTSIARTTPDVNYAPEAAGNLPQGVGAAEVDFLTPDSHSTERTSNLATGAAEFTAREGEATGLERADYDRLFRYQTETEAQRRQQATNLLYFNKDGQRAFLGDFDPEGYQELVDYLTNAPAWNGVMTETAMLIKNEMQGRALFDPMFPVPENGFGVTQEDYAGWLQVMREHATETGRGTQAWAAWTRRDNEGGQATELEAWENLQESRLSEDERREVFAQVVQYDHAIEQAQTPEALGDIILDIANQRGTTHGLTGKQSKRLTDRARKALGSLSFDELKQLAYASSAALTTDKTPADAGQKIKTIQVLNMLSSPKTTMTNLTGNTSFYGVDAMAMRGAALLDMALGKVTGTRSVAMEQLTGNRQSRADIAKAIQRSLAEITLDVDMGGEGRYGQSGRRTFKADGAGLFGTGKGVDKFAERALSVMERNMGYALTTTDEAYKGAARSTAHATQQLVDEGKIKTENADYAREQADDLAKYRTFQKDGYIANALQVVHDWLNAIPFLGTGDSGKRVGSDGQLKVHSFGAGDLVAPFTRVAGNLVSTAIDYNPAKAVQGTVEIVDTIRKARQGDIDPARQAKAVSDTARGLTGTAIALAACELAKAGLIRRAEDEDDEDVAALNQSEGMTGTQFNIDAAMRWVKGEGAEWRAGDTLVDVSRLEPLNFIFSFGAELADNENDGFLSTVGEVVGDAGKALVSAAGDLPVMGTVAGVAKDTLVYGDDLGTALAENLGKTAVSSVTPNILAAAAKGLDDKQRSTYSGDGVGDVLVDTMLSRIPGLRETLPTTVNSLGEEKDNPGNLAQRLINAMVNPLGVNEYSQSEVSQEMARVREETGETGFYPSKSIPAKVSYTKDGVTHEAELTFEQRQQYQMARSGAQMSVSAALIGSNGYQNADAKTQAALLDRAYDYANQFARGQVLGKGSMEGWAVNSQTAQADIGVSQAEFFCLYEKYGSGIMGGSGYEKTKRMVKAGLTVDQWAAMKSKVDADGNGSANKAEVTRYIEGHFPRKQWRQIFDAYKGGSNWKNPY